MEFLLTDFFHAYAICKEIYVYFYTHLLLILFKKVNARRERSLVLKRIRRRKRKKKKRRRPWKKETGKMSSARKDPGANPGARAVSPQKTSS